MSSLTFKVGHQPKDKVQQAAYRSSVTAWQQFLNDRFRRWDIPFSLMVDGVYGAATRAATVMFARAWGAESGGMVVENGLSPWWRTKLRTDRRSIREEAIFRSPNRIAYRRALRQRYRARHVAMPVAKIIADSNGWYPGHDGIDLICLPDAPLHAVCKAEVVRADEGGWWGKGAPSDPALKAKGDGITIIKSLVNAGPIRKGDCFGYGHAERPRVRIGEVVQAGQHIANAGFANAWHPHFMLNRGTFPPAVGRGDADPAPILDYIRKHA